MRADDGAGVAKASAVYGTAAGDVCQYRAEFGDASAVAGER